MGGMKFSNNAEVQAEVDAYFEGLEESFFKSGVMALESRWNKCIQLDGDYVEK